LVTDTARDAWRWYQSHFLRETQFPIGGLGLSAEREQQILETAGNLPTGVGNTSHN
jgi:hypothetical protein